MKLVSGGQFILCWSKHYTNVRDKKENTFTERLELHTGSKWKQRRYIRVHTFVKENLSKYFLSQVKSAFSVGITFQSPSQSGRDIVAGVRAGGVSNRSVVSSGGSWGMVSKLRGREIWRCPATDDISQRGF